MFTAFNRVYPLSESLLAEVGFRGLNLVQGGKW